MDYGQPRRAAINHEGALAFLALAFATPVSPLLSRSAAVFSPEQRRNRCGTQPEKPRPVMADPYNRRRAVTCHLLWLVRRSDGRPGVYQQRRSTTEGASGAGHHQDSPYRQRASVSPKRSFRDLKVGRAWRFGRAPLPSPTVARAALPGPLAPPRQPSRIPIRQDAVHAQPAATARMRMTTADQR